MKMLDFAHYSYIMQLFNIHKQAELTKTNGHVSPIAYRIEWSWTKGYAAIHFRKTKVGTSAIKCRSYELAQ